MHVFSVRAMTAAVAVASLALIPVAGDRPKPLVRARVLPMDGPVEEDRFVAGDTLTEEGRIGKVTDIQGIVSVKPVAGRRFMPVVGPRIVQPGDWLRTDVRGANAVVLRLVKETSITLGPGSLVELPGPKRIKLSSGTAKTVVDRKSPIELLGPNDQKVLRAAPALQLEAIIDRTTVPQQQRRAFLGKAAAATLAALCAGQADEASGRMPPAAGGARVDVPKPKFRGATGIRPEPPVEPRPPQIPQLRTTIFDRHIRAILAAETGVPVPRIGGNTRLVADLHIDPETARRVRIAILRRFGVRIRDDVAAQIHTVDDLITAVIMHTRMGQAVVGALARHFRIAPQGIKYSTALPQKLKADAKMRAGLAATLSKKLGVTVTADALANVQTVGDLIVLLTKPNDAGHGNAPAGAGQSAPVSRGIRPDLPAKGGSFGLRPD